MTYGSQQNVMMYLFLAFAILSALGAVFLLGKLTHKIGKKYFGSQPNSRRRSIDTLHVKPPETPATVAVKASGHNDQLIDKYNSFAPLSVLEDGLKGAVREHRTKGVFTAKMRQLGGRAIEVRVWDLSAGGFCAEWPHKLRRGDRVWLAAGGTESLAAIVAWAKDFTIGCKFEIRLHPAVLDNVVLRAVDSQNR